MLGIPAPLPAADEKAPVGVAAKAAGADAGAVSGAPVPNEAKRELITAIT